MSLYKIKDFDSNYNAHSDDPDIKGLSMYVGNEKIGSINDVLVDDEGKFRYLVVDTGGWILGKKVLLPIGHARIDYSGKRVYADTLTKTQVEALPEFTDDMLMDYDQEERLIASKNRQKTGETVINKRVETETANASVGIEKERIVIERIPVSSGTVVSPSEANFQAGEVARMDIYEEVPEFHKEAFVREEVRVSKVVDQETATAQEQLRREELNVDTEGRPVVKNNI